MTTTFGPTDAPFLPPLRTATHAKVPSHSDPTSHPLPSPSSPKPHSQRPKPNPALYDSDANAKCRAWLYPSLPTPPPLTAAKNHEPRALLPFPTAHTRPRPPQLPLPSATHLSITCTQARTLAAVGIRLACILIWRTAQGLQTTGGSYGVLWVVRINHRVRLCRTKDPRCGRRAYDQESMRMRTRGV
jgi:hypothetical protein